MPAITEASVPTVVEDETSNVVENATDLVAQDADTIDSDTPKLILPYEYAEDEHYYFEEVVVKKKPLFSFVKRIFDFTVCLLALIVLALPMLIIAIIIKIHDNGPVFYSQDRLGYKGKTFKLVKFRTMRVDAEKLGAQWSQGEKDPRITKIGVFLRKTRLDEIPQLWACVTGKLSLIGPRPEREIFYNEFEKHVHGFRERLKIKPGLTGLAQVSGGYDLRPEEKLAYDLEYIKKRSIWLDIKIIFKTIGVIFSHKGAK